MEQATNMTGSSGRTRGGYPLEESGHEGWRSDAGGGSGFPDGIWGSM